MANHDLFVNVVPLPKFHCCHRFNRIDALGSVEMSECPTPSDSAPAPAAEAAPTEARQPLEPPLSPDELESRLASLPPRPGCYIFRDRRGEVLYVGKAKNLRS